MNQLTNQLIPSYTEDEEINEDENQISNINQDMLDSIGAGDWIPEEFICPIKRCVFDGIPVFATDSPARFDRNAILKWLESNNTNPLTRNPLSQDQLQNDVLLERKIRLTLEMIREKIDFLKSSTPLEAKNQVVLWVNTIDKKITSTSSLALQSREAKISKSKDFFNFASNVFSFYYSSTRQLNKKAEQNPFAALTQFIERNGSCYDILKIDASASNAVIQSAFKKLALQYHPDRNSAADAAIQFDTITQARNFLMNETSRRAHDYLCETILYTQNTQKASF